MGDRRRREGDSVATMMLILHFKNSIAISGSAFSLGYGIDIDEAHRPRSYKQESISRKRTGWIAASVFLREGKELQV